MAAEIITLNPADPGQAYTRCREVIMSGGVIVYPTDTFYGLGVDPENENAVRKLFRIKGRRADQPILLLISDRTAVLEWAAATTPEAEVLMDTFWPGPLTLVFPALPAVLFELTAGTHRIGLRVPGNALTRQLLMAVGRGSALTGTSANVSGGPNPRTAQEAADALGEKVDLILDAGRTPGGYPSSVVDASTAELKIIREGAIPSHELRGRMNKIDKRT